MASLVPFVIDPSLRGSFGLGGTLGTSSAFAFALALVATTAMATPARCASSSSPLALSRWGKCLWPGSIEVLCHGHCQGSGMLFESHILVRLQQLDDSQTEESRTSLLSCGLMVMFSRIPLRLSSLQLPSIVEAIVIAW